MASDWLQNFSLMSFQPLCENCRWPFYDYSAGAIFTQPKNDVGHFHWKNKGLEPGVV